MRYKFTSPTSILSRLGYHYCATAIDSTPYKSETKQIERYSVTFSRHLFFKYIYIRNPENDLFVILHDDYDIATLGCPPDIAACTFLLGIAEHSGVREVELVDRYSDPVYFFQHGMTWYEKEFGFEPTEDADRYHRLKDYWKQNPYLRFFALTQPEFFTHEKIREIECDAKGDIPTFWGKAFHGKVTPYSWNRGNDIRIHLMKSMAKHKDYILTYKRMDSYENLRRVDGYIVGTLRRPVSVDIVVLNEMLQPIAFIVCHKDSTLATLVCKEEDPVAHTCLRVAQDEGITDIQVFSDTWERRENVYFVLHGQTWWEKEMGFQSTDSRELHYYEEAKRIWQTKFNVKDKSRDYFTYEIMKGFREEFGFHSYRYPCHWHKQLDTSSKNE